MSRGLTLASAEASAMARSTLASEEASAMARSLLRQSEAFARDDDVLMARSCAQNARRYVRLAEILLGPNPMAQLVLIVERDERALLPFEDDEE